jgi:hypothetical protein
MTKSKPLPPIERLFEVFYYDESGQLFWKKNPHRYGQVIPGKPVLSVDATGYGRVKLDKQSYKIHRIIWAMANGQDPGEFEIDHINRDKLDNRPQNLRLATSKQNKQNRIHATVGSTGEQCIHRNPPRCKQKPYIVRVKRVYLGTFATMDEAKLVRDAYLESIRSEFSPI